MVTATPASDSFDLKSATVGRPLPHVGVKIVDTEGATVPLDQPGELLVRGFGVMKGYFKMPDKTAEAIDADGWLHSGDLATMDSAGYIRIVGRIKDMIIRGGENIYPAEVEDVLLGHAGVREVGVIGQPSDRWGESPCAVIVRAEDWQRSDAELVEELKAFVQSRLARYKQPRAFELIDVLPRNPSGKILKRLLREKFPGPAPE